MPKLNAKPESVEVDFTKSAVIVVDMQNAFASKKGLLILRAWIFPERLQ